MPVIAMRLARQVVAAWRASFPAIADAWGDAALYNSACDYARQARRLRGAAATLEGAPRARMMREAVRYEALVRSIANLVIRRTVVDVG